MNFEWSRSLKFRITLIFSAGIAIAFCINWMIAVKTMRGEKIEDLEKVLKHLLIESGDEYISGSLTPSEDLSYLYHVPHNRMILKDSEASHLRFVVSSNPHLTAQRVVAASLRLPNGYYLNALSDDLKIENSIRKYAEKLLIRYAISLAAILFVIMFVLDYYMRPLAMLAEHTREWKGDKPFDFLDQKAATEIAEVSAAFGSLVRKLEGYRKKEAELFKEAAHELKTPLALMRSRLDVYQSGDHYPKERFSTDLGHDIERMTTELKNVLFLESSDFEEPIEVDLRAAIGAIVHKMGILIERKQLAIRLLEETFAVKVPEKLLHKVLTALLENAITYAQEKTTVDIAVDAALKSVSIGNAIGNEKYLFSSKIGQKMLNRISRDIGFSYTVCEEPAYYRIKLSFS